MNTLVFKVSRLTGICVWVNGLIVLFLAAYFLILPGFILTLWVSPGIGILTVLFAVLLPRTRPTRQA